MNTTRIVAAVGVATAMALPAWGEEEEKVLEPGRWYPSVETGVNITQSSYSDNWSGGDKGSIVWSWILNATAENQLSAKLHTHNTLKLAYGQTHQQRLTGDGGRNWDRPEKSTDLVDFETVERLTMGWIADPYVSGRFESQFQDASDGAGRTIALNPLKFKESAGFARKLINEENRELLTRVGFAFRQNVRKQFDNPAPDRATSSESTNDGGFEWVTDYKNRILNDRVTWTSKLTFYQPIFFSGKSDLEGLTAAQADSAGVDRDVASFTTAMDVDFENIFTTQITKIISVNLYVRWVYDKYDNSVAPVVAGDGSLASPGDVRGAIRKAGQFKQTLGIGVTYRFL